MAAKFALFFCIFGLLGMQSAFGYFSDIYENMNSDLLYNQGNPVLLNSYPFYSYNSINYPTKFYNNLPIYYRIAQIAMKYGVSQSDLWQLYFLLYTNFPGLTTDQYLQILEDLACLLEQEKYGKIINPYDPAISYQFPSLNNISKYFPSDIPLPYLLMWCYLDSLIPPLSQDAKQTIKNSIYNNTPASQRVKADLLSFQLRTAMRYILSNELSFYSNAY